LEKRFTRSLLTFTDQDGMPLAIVGIADAKNEPGWRNGDLPSEHMIRGLQGVTQMMIGAERTDRAR
jgi:glyoxalase family protein